jgi:diguanylate cyclase (GGDEF)-like protein
LANVAQPTSLRRRYALVTLILAILIITGGVIGQRFVAPVGQAATSQIQVRNILLEKSRHIRDNVWMAREAIEAFLLDPHKSERRQSIRDGIQAAADYAEDLERYPWIVSHDLGAGIQRLQQALVALKAATDKLVRVRISPSRQYPALDVARGVMLPAQDVFYSAMGLALDELGEAATPADAEAKRLFLRARHLWSLAISNYRMYLANRLGSYDESVLTQQEKDIEILLDGTKQKLAELHKLDRRGELGFQGSDSLAQIEASYTKWRSAYQRVKEINHSGRWRSDARILRDEIEPLLETIWAQLVTLDVALENSADKGVASLSAAARAQTHILWLLVGISLLVITLGYVSLEYVVLRPISRITEALRSEATGKTVIEVPAATSSETQNLVDAFTDMRDQVLMRQLELEYQAMYDSLTGLANRSCLNDRLQQAIVNARRSGGQVALLIMDLNGFKEVNDTLGHYTGDLLLKQVAKRLQHILREMDTVARLGGDEFAVLLQTATLDSVALVARKILDGMQEVIIVEDKHHLYVEGSIGIALYPEHGNDPQTLTQKADVAMYVAKRKKLGFAVYDTSFDEHSVGRLALQSDLRNALRNNQLELYFQPQVSVAERRVIGCEALLRWQHPEHGFVPPNLIVPMAEQTGLIKPLTNWVLDKALQQCVQWHHQGIQLHVSVNLSVFNLHDKEIVEQVEHGLASYRAKPEHLILEITESAMMADPDRAIEILGELDKMGVRLSVDDFGTGFSSLAYLKQLPVDELKVDRSFVMDMNNDENDAVIVRSTIDLAHNLGLKVVAEGVEDNDALDLLDILGCDLAQGYYLSRPLPAQEFDAWLQTYQVASA